MKRIFSTSTTSAFVLLIMSCGGPQTSKTLTDNAAGKQPDSEVNKMATTAASTSTDDAAINSVETEDYILKLHKVVSFTPKPKAYQPFKIDPDTKLIVLDISVRNKQTSPLNFSRILGMTEIRGRGSKNLLSPWVVAAYMVDYPDNNHQKEYDALWSNHFEANGFHRAILLGINPKKEESNFTLIVPGKPDFNNPEKKELNFKTE